VETVYSGGLASPLAIAQTSYTTAVGAAVGAIVGSAIDTMLAKPIPGDQWIKSHPLDERKSAHDELSKEKHHAGLPNDADVKVDPETGDVYGPNGDVIGGVEPCE